MDVYKTVEIPHLRFKVYFLDMSKLKGVEIKGSGYTCVFEENSACIFIEDIKKSVKSLERIPTIAHEILHVIQILCEKYQMKIENEQEHTAYLMHYLLTEVMK